MVLISTFSRKVFDSFGAVLLGFEGDACLTLADIKSNLLDQCCQVCRCRFVIRFFVIPLAFGGNGLYHANREMEWNTVSGVLLLVSSGYHDSLGWEIVFSLSFLIICTGRKQHRLLITRNVCIEDIPQ